MRAGPTDVVLIDINGSRALPAVVACIRVVTGELLKSPCSLLKCYCSLLNALDDVACIRVATAALSPRLIIVKSNALAAVANGGRRPPTDSC